MTITGLHDFVKVSNPTEFSSSPSSWSCVSTSRSPQQILVPQVWELMMQAGKQAPIFRRWEEYCFCFSPFNLEHFWPASTLLRGHLALATLSLLETDPQILEHRVYADEDLLGKYFQAMDGFSAFYTSDWFLYFWALPQSRCRLRRLLILEYATQLSCNFPHSHCNFVIIPSGHYTRLSINLAMCIRAPFPNSETTLRLAEQAEQILEDATLHRMNWCILLWGDPCKRERSESQSLV